METNIQRQFILMKAKKYEELWSKIRDLVSSITKTSGDYDNEYMKIKFNWNEELPLNETIESRSRVIVVRANFHGNNKYYPRAFLDECLYKSWII